LGRTSGGGRQAQVVDRDHLRLPVAEAKALLVAAIPGAGGGNGGAAQERRSLVDV
jgi:hypothetical protein